MADLANVADNVRFAQVAHGYWEAWTKLDDRVFVGRGFSQAAARQEMAKLIELIEPDKKSGLGIAIQEIKWADTGTSMWEVKLTDPDGRVSMFVRSVGSGKGVPDALRNLADQLESGTDDDYERVE